MCVVMLRPRLIVLDPRMYVVYSDEKMAMGPEQEQLLDGSSQVAHLLLDSIEAVVVVLVPYSFSACPRPSIQLSG